MVASGVRLASGFGREFGLLGTVGHEWPSALATPIISLYKEASPLATPLGINATFDQEGKDT
jgi:hypothetical protein